MKPERMYPSADHLPEHPEVDRGVEERLRIAQIASTTRYRLALVPAEESKAPAQQLDRSPVAADFFARQLSDRPQEELLAVFLDIEHRLIGWQRALVGTLKRASFEPRAILQGSLLCNASAFIVGHNHPQSNVPMPSREDLDAAQRLAKGGAAIGIELHDYIVVGEQGRWVSLKGKGWW